MKIDCEVLCIETNGETLSIRAQGTVKGAAFWRPMSSIKIKIPDVHNSNRTFYVGRKFSLELTPK